MIWNFTGTYSNWNVNNNDYCSDDGSRVGEVAYHDCMHQQLPFQFLGNPAKTGDNVLQENFASAMLSINNNNTEFNNIDIGYDWGIAGQVPVDADGSPISKNTFRPHHLATFDYNDDNDAKKWYANDFLEQISSLNNSFFQPKFLRLDALNRMQNVKHRLSWLNAIKEKLPSTKLAPESSIDYMHAQAGMINQLDSTDGFKGNFKDIDQPDFLAMYLNPGMENIVNLDSIFTTKDHRSRKSYVQTLVKLGYTPLVKYYDEALGNVSTGDVNENELVDVHNLNNNYIDKCLNNDGVEDWPYDEACRIKNFNQ